MTRLSLFSFVIISVFIGACSHSPQRQQQQVQRYHQKIPSYSQSSPSSMRIHPARKNIVNVTKSTLGTPYKWGGNTRRGFDCSGLVKYVHKEALGVNVPRTAAKQRDSSSTVSYSQLQPGDLLFFKTGRRTNHVGVYIGNRKFIHAPSRGKRVSVASMNSSYWRKNFVKFGTFF